MKKCTRGVVGSDECGPQVRGHGEQKMRGFVKENICSLVRKYHEINPGILRVF